MRYFSQCRLGHMNWPGLRRLQQVSRVSIALRYKLSFSACYVMSKSKQAPYQIRVSSQWNQKKSSVWLSQDLRVQIVSRNCLFFFGIWILICFSHESEAASTIQNLILRLHNAECYPDTIQTYVSDHGGKPLWATSSRSFCLQMGYFSRAGQVVLQITMQW